MKSRESSHQPSATPKRPSRNYFTILAATAVLSFAIVSFLVYHEPSLAKFLSLSVATGSGILNSVCPSSANHRSNFPSPILSNTSTVSSHRSTVIQYGARVACWPSTGGIWIKHATPPELDWLKLNRTHNTPRPSPPILLHSDLAGLPPYSILEEDMFCQKLRLLGASFWELPEDLDERLGDRTIEESSMPKINGEFGFAWPPGHGCACMVNLTDAAINHGPGLKGFNNYPDIASRWEAVEELGGYCCAGSLDEAACRRMWCMQYQEYCEETKWLFEPEKLYYHWHEYSYMTDVDGNPWEPSP